MPPLDGKFPLALAGGLRTTFDEVLSAPLPAGLATLMSRLGANGNAPEQRGPWGEAHPRRTVLIVEDDLDVRNVAAALLETRTSTLSRVRERRPRSRVMLMGACHCLLALDRFGLGLVALGHVEQLGAGAFIGREREA
jgi:hypothetical protein